MLGTMGDGRSAGVGYASAWQRAALGGLIGALLCVGACSKVPAPSAAAPTAAGNFDFVGWDQYLGGVDSSQYSSLNQVNKGNVGQLKEAFHKELGNGPHESIPIAYRGGSRFPP